jgi:hypothetical protein
MLRDLLTQKCAHKKKLLFDTPELRLWLKLAKIDQKWNFSIVLKNLIFLKK